MPIGEPKAKAIRYKPEIENRDAIVDYLIKNQEFIKEKCKHYDELNKALLETVNKHMHRDIETQYKEEVMNYICEIVALHTNFDAESIMMVIEDMDLKEYFEVAGG